MNNESTREKIKSIFEGMMYHTRELSEFMAKTVHDPYFETKEGQTLRRCAIGIMSNHLTAVTTYMLSKTEDVDKKESFDFEDFLKDSFK